jgi:hypothetical protein
MKRKLDLDSLDDLHVVGAITKVLRQNNAKKFIQALNHTFTESQEKHLIDLLCDYERFLEDNN